MARPERNRHISQPPLMKGYRPYGISASPTETINLTFEEYECIRLLNYENLMQEEAAIHMKVSRPTLTRIYNRALQKIADAFVKGKIIVIDGGNYSLENDWFKCRKCHKLFEGENTHIKCAGCADFGKSELIPLNR